MAGEVWQWQSLAAGPHTVTIESFAGRMVLDGLIVRPWPGWMRWWPAFLAALLLLVFTLVAFISNLRGVRLRRR